MRSPFPPWLLAVLLLLPAPAGAGEAPPIPRPSSGRADLWAEPWSPEPFAPESAPATPVGLGVSGMGDTSIAVLDNRLAIAFIDAGADGRALLWYDDGRGEGIAGNARADGGEVRVLGSLAVAETPAVSVAPWSGRLAVAYSGGRDRPLLLWVDDGGTGDGIPDDGVPQGSETRMLGGLFRAGGEIIVLRGRLTVLWHDGASGSLLLWHDDGAGGGVRADGVPNGLEVRVLDAAPGARIGNGRTMAAIGRTLTVVYWEPVDPVFANLRLWHDDGKASAGRRGDLQINGQEDRLLDTFPVPRDWWASVTDVGGLMAVAFHERGFVKDLVLWHDDGGALGDGEAGDVEPSLSEFRPIAEVGETGLYNDITTVNGRLAASFQLNLVPELLVWVDDGKDGGVPGDALANGAVSGLRDSFEVRAADLPVFGGGAFSSITTFNPDPANPAICDHLAVSHYVRCTSCRYPNDLAVHLTTMNILAARGSFIHDAGDHLFHEPIAIQQDVTLTVRWLEDGADFGDVFLSGDVTGPGAGVWIPLQQNINSAWPNHMTIPMQLTPGDGDKLVFAEFRSGSCSGNLASRTILLDTTPLPDPPNLRLDLTLASDTVLTWDPVVDPLLFGYNVHRTNDTHVDAPGEAPRSWGAINAFPLADTAYIDLAGDLGAGIELRYYYITAVDPSGNESSAPPTKPLP